MQVQLERLAGNPSWDQPQVTGTFSGSPSCFFTASAFQA